MLMKFAIQNFKEDKQMQNVSKKTMENYNYILGNFETWAGENNLERVEDVKLADIKSYLWYLKTERNNGPVAINDKLKVLRTFFNYMISIEAITKNPAKEQKYAKEEIRIQVFDDDQVKKMLSYYRRLNQKQIEFWSYRDYMIIITLMSTGLRLGELCSVKWNDIDWHNNFIRVWGKKREDSTVPMADKLKGELLKYQKYCEKHFGKLNEFVFTNISNKQLTENGVKNIFKRLSAKMKFKNVRLSAHTFRHYFAKQCVLAGCDAITLMKLLRHKSVQMSMRYVDLWGTDLQKLNEKYNPINHLDI